MDTFELTKFHCCLGDKFVNIFSNRTGILYAGGHAVLGLGSTQIDTINEFGLIMMLAGQTD